MTPRAASKHLHSFDDIARTVSLFSAVRRIMRTKLAKDKKPDPSTWLQIETMKFIADHDKPKMKDLSKYLSITAPSTTSLVNGLVKNKLVTCSIDRRDRRTSHLALTAKGETKLTATITNGIKTLSELFAVLSAEELSTFVQTLEQIKNKA